jgi:hypothetical protein
VFLQTLGEACGKTGWQVHAYCLNAGDNDDVEMDCGTAGDGQLEPCVESCGRCGEESGNVKSAKSGNRPEWRLVKAQVLL